MKRVIACLLVLVVCTVASAGFDSPGKVFEWAFEGNAADTSGGTSNGAWSGTEAYGTGVFGGQAAVLDGSSGVKAAGVAASITDLMNEPYGDNGWTMNVWVNLAVEDISDWAIIAGIGNSNGLNGRFIHQGVGNVVQFSGFGPWGFTDEPYAVNDWTMVTVVAKYSSFSVYVDGEHAPGNQLDAWIGAADLGGSDIFVGMIHNLGWSYDRNSD